MKKTVSLHLITFSVGAALAVLLDVLWRPELDVGSVAMSVQVPTADETMGRGWDAGASEGVVGAGDTEESVVMPEVKPPPFLSRPFDPALVTLLQSDFTVSEDIRRLLMLTDLEVKEIEGAYRELLDSIKSWELENHRFEDNNGMVSLIVPPFPEEGLRMKHTLDERLTSVIGEDRTRVLQSLCHSVNQEILGDFGNRGRYITEFTYGNNPGIRHGFTDHSTSVKVISDDFGPQDRVSHLSDLIRNYRSDLDGSESHEGE